MDGMKRFSFLDGKLVPPSKELGVSGPSALAVHVRDFVAKSRARATRFGGSPAAGEGASVGPPSLSYLRALGLTTPVE